MYVTWNTHCYTNVKNCDCQTACHNYYNFILFSYNFSVNMNLLVCCCSYILQFLFKIRLKMDWYTIYNTEFQIYIEYLAWYSHFVKQLFFWSEFLLSVWYITRWQRYLSISGYWWWLPLDAQTNLVLSKPVKILSLVILMCLKLLVALAWFPFDVSNNKTIKAILHKTKFKVFFSVTFTS